MMAPVQEWNITQAFIPTKCSLGEGSYYIKERNELRYLDINNSKLFVVDLNVGASSIKTIDTKMPVGVTADIDGVDSSKEILCGAKDGVTKFNLETGEHEYIAKYWQGSDAEEKSKRMRSNDGNVDSSGRFWVEVFDDPEIAEPTKEAVLFLLGHDGKLTLKSEGHVIPNGISWRNDDTMYMTESPVGEVLAFDYDPETGGISNRRVFFHLDESEGHPDGHTMDVDGNIWHAVYGGSKVIRISPAGDVTGVIHLPTRNLTCPVFAGTSLYITSAKEAEPEKYPDSANFAGNLFKIDVGVEGVPRHKAKLNV